MYHKRMCLVLSAIFCCFTFTVSAQHKSKEWWIGVGYSFPVYAEALPERVDYKAHLFTAYLAHAPFVDHSFWYRLSFYAEPQFAPVSLTESSETGSDYGINFGVRLDWLTLDALRSYIFLGAGPHSMKVQTSLQRDGFLFSDNIGFGFLLPLPETKFDIALESRFRHMSNAGLKTPNGGVDNAFIGLKILYKPAWDGGCYSCPRW